MVLGIAVYQATFGQGTGPILLSIVDCTGIESSLLSCSHVGDSIFNCSHLSDAGVICPSCKPCIWVKFISKFDTSPRQRFFISANSSQSLNFGPLRPPINSLINVFLPVMTYYNKAALLNCIFSCGCAGPSLRQPTGLPLLR